MSDTRNQIIESMARALYVCAYADMIDNAREDGEDVDDLPRAPRDERDWMDCAPDTSEAALDIARKLAAAIEGRAKATLAELYRDASEECANQIALCHRGEHTADLFGHYIAMQSLGHGVAWSDNHAPLTFEIPSVEFHLAGRGDLAGGWGSVSERFWS